MEKQKTVSQWIDENGLTTLDVALAIRYSPGAVSKWRQEISHPTARAEKKLIEMQKRRGWTPFPARLAV
jgi:hypothetical protein